MAVLRELDVEGRELRLPRDFEGVDGLIIPGGESTTLSHLINLYDISPIITDMAQKGRPIWGTCAGMIMLARDLLDKKPATLGLMDIQINRNAYGRQINSFEADLNIDCIGPTPFKGVFIRAPSIAQVGNGVKILSSLANKEPVAVQEGNLLATSFHPELTTDTRLHEYFLTLT
jgi:5'-phosphate synthase pdxT subunit